tara:strand:- start:473 stop:1465 length:993 start_codon:yes stop_codon:yes gene_type:complete
VKAWLALLAVLTPCFNAANPLEEDFFYYDYSERDWEVVDYQNYSLPGISVWKFRGPRPALKDGRYFSSIGAAQTLGVLIDKPYPTLLAEELDLGALNLGLGGASPSAYANDESLIEIINNGKFLILQVMRASSEANDRFTPTRQLGLVENRRTGELGSLSKAWAKILREEPENAPLLVAQSQNSWVKNHLDLLAKIKVPVILFWFSPRKIDVPEPDYNVVLTRPSEFMSEYPSMVDMATLERVRKLCDLPGICAAYVEVRSERGRDFEFISRFTGEVTEIDYTKLGVGDMQFKKKRNTATSYWSQEMHDDAVAPLLEAIRNLKHDQQAKQ